MPSIIVAVYVCLLAIRYNVCAKIKMQTIPAEVFFSGDESMSTKVDSISPVIIFSSLYLKLPFTQAANISNLYLF